MITLLVVAACLLAIELVFGKRFGVLVLALAAGLLLSQYQAGTLEAVLAPYLNQYATYIPAALVLLPSIALVVLMRGRHRKIPQRLIAAVIYAVAGAVFLVASPNTPSSISGNFPIIHDNLGLFVAGLTVLAVLEVAFGKASKKKVVEEKK